MTPEPAATTPLRGSIPRRLLVAVILAATLLTGFAALMGNDDDPAVPVAGPGVEVRLEVVQGPRGQTLAFVPVVINGEGPFPFALDTGAAHSVIARGLAEQLGLPVVGESEPVIGVAGAAEADLVEVETWRIDDLELPGQTLTAIDLPDVQGPASARGRLGSDVLSQYGAITIDYDNQVLILRPREPASP